MSNAKSMSTGGANSAVGPVELRKATAFRGNAQNIIPPEQSLYKDNLFSSVRGRLENISFTLDTTRMPPELNSQMQTIREQLVRAVTFEKPSREVVQRTGDDE